MPDILIKVPVPDELVDVFAGRDLMITPLSEGEAKSLAIVLQSLADNLALNIRCLSTLQQVLETRASQEPDIAKTLVQMRGPNKQASDMLEWLRVLLGKSVRVGQRPDRGAMQ